MMMTRFSTATSNTVRFVPSAKVVRCVNRFLMLPNEQIYIYGCQRLISHLTFKNVDEEQDKQRIDFIVSR